MPNFKNRVGERYGRLLVVAHAGKDKRGKHLWECKCDCGKTKVVTSDNLSSGKSRSCGCLLREFLLRRGNQFGLYEDREIAIFKVQYNHLRRRHAKFGGKIISLNEFIEKSKQPCFYCGLPYSKELHDRRNETIGAGLLSDTIVKCNGLDRVDNAIGYTFDNTVPCCKNCNTAKNTMTQDEFKSWIKRIYEHYAQY